jgi:hypothetical protein
VDRPVPPRKERWAAIKEVEGLAAAWREKDAGGGTTGRTPLPLIG